MPATIRFTECEGYLLFQFEGEDCLTVSLDYWKDVGEQCRRLGYKKALVIENMSGQLSTHDMFLLCRKLPSLVFGLKVAYVDLRPDTLDGNNFGELVAQNRGCWVTVFQEEGLAVKWLLET